jgi:hypothetical protein
MIMKLQINLMKLNSMFKKIIYKTIIFLGLSLLLTSCTEDDPLTCYETVTGYYLETYYQGYYSGCCQYTVFTVDSYGTGYTYVDATNTPYIGMCW